MAISEIHSTGRQRKKKPITHQLEMERRRVRQRDRVATKPFVDRNKYVPAVEDRKHGSNGLREA